MDAAAVEAAAGPKSVTAAFSLSPKSPPAVAASPRPRTAAGRRGWGKVSAAMLKEASVDSVAADAAPAALALPLALPAAVVAAAAAVVVVGGEGEAPAAETVMGSPTASSRHVAGPYCC